jgi:molybdopterin molybdotransferase
MIPLEDALRIVDDTLPARQPAAETLAVREAAGRALTSDEVSRLDLPPFNKSAMDGFAILQGDERETYRVLETVAAGAVGAERLVEGTAVEVMTGAAVPEGAGRVIMVEHTERDGDTIAVHTPSSAANICWQGEDVRRGDVVMAAGTVLGPLDVANLVACGVTEIRVAKPVRLAVISTGDEIVDSPEQLAPGRIMNSNGPLLVGLARVFGLEVVSEDSVGDRRDAILAALAGALEAADIVVLSGGVSVGEFDFVTDAVSDAGLTVHFTRVSVKPGKPMTYASAPGRATFALPGNPVSVYLMFHLFVLRAAARMLGAQSPVREHPIQMATDYRRRKAERLEYVPCRLNEGAAEPLRYHGSAHLTALTASDGFFVVPRGVDALSAGDRVLFMPRVRGWS